MRRATALAVALTAVITVAPTPTFTTVTAAALDTVAARNGTPTTVQSFRLLGASWEGAVPDGARVRVRTEAGWRPWQELEVEDEHGPDPATAEAETARHVSSPVWVGEADAYELDLPAGAAEPRVHLAREVTRRVQITATTPTAEAATATPSMHGRGRWGARDPKSSPEYAGTVKMAFVHHTVNTNEYTEADVPSMLRSIQAYHMDANGWNDIAYNFLVDRYGAIWEGRAGGIDRAVIGAHTEGFNTGSTGVAVLGEFTSVQPSGQVIEAVARLLGWKLPLTGVDPAGSTTMTSGGNDRYRQGTVVNFQNVSGHRDGKATACPGEKLYGRLAEIRRDASAHAGAATAYPGFQGGMFVAAGQLDGDSQAEFATGADVPGGPHVRTFDANGASRGGGFLAYDHRYTGGVRIAIGNVDALTSADEIVTAAGPHGGPHVRVLREDGAEVGGFFAYDPAFKGGVYVATGNFDGLPGDEVITAPGPGGGPHVRVFTATGLELTGFMAYDSRFINGVRVAAADIDGDGIDEIVTAPGPGGGPHVRAWKPGGQEVLGFMAYSSAFSGGVYIASTDQGANQPDLLITGAGEQGGPHVRVWNPSGTERIGFFAAFPPNGVRVAGGRFRGATPGDLAVVGGPGALSIVKLTRLDGSLIFLS